jgi:hypothetical protein
MLAQAVTANAARLDAIDVSGTRGVGALAVQVSEVIRDVSDVRTELREFRRDHQKQHDDDARNRSAARRWGWAFGVAALAAVESPLLYLLAHAH